MSESKRFEITEYGSDYYIEIIDNEKELDESIDNPSQKLGLVECVDLLNEQQDHISYWKHKVNSLLWILSQFDEEKVKELLKEVEDE